MALRTGEQYKEGQAKIKHNLYINGNKAENLEDNPNTKTVLDANVKVFDLGLEPQYDEIMSLRESPVAYLFLSKGPCA